MASLLASLLLFFTTLSFMVPGAVSATVIEDLANLNPPPDFNATITANCLHNPSLRFCNSILTDLNEIFKSTIVASHLCNESKNPNCVESFPKIDLRSRPKIAPLYLSFTFFWKYCPLTILYIDLSNNSLKGTFPTDVLLCTQIQALDLSRNELSGDVPTEAFYPLSNLTLLNLSYNHFSESKISDAEFFQRFNSSSFLHSGLLPSHQKYKIKTLFLLIGFPVFIVLMVGCLWWLCFRRPDFLPGSLRNKHIFTPSMLKAATDGFSKMNLMGQTEEVSVYRGNLRDGTEVRIEMYWDNVSREDRRKFAEECKVLVQLWHKNLVRVYGWCDRRKLRAIVTEWTDEESVEVWLSESAPTWNQRTKVLTGVLEGMLYMQEQWPDIGYDLRTSNVLLSDKMDPLISTFKVGDPDITTKKIYKFGVFLLEMMANRRLCEEFYAREAELIECIRMHYPRDLRKVIDERMKLTETRFGQAKQAIDIGLTCTDQARSQQLSLSQILNMMARLQESCLALVTQSHRKSQADGGRGHKGIHSR